MDNLISDYAPIAIVAILALCVVWVLLRILGALFRRRPERSAPVGEPVLSSPARQEPRLVAEPPQPPARSPDAADIHGLKQSIDALSAQIARLEQRLATSDA